MSWILALYIVGSSDTFAKEFATEAECKTAMKELIYKSRNDETVSKITCTPGIVISADAGDDKI